MQNFTKILGNFLAVAVLSVGLATAQTNSAARYDESITTTATQKLASRSKFGNVKASTQDGVITLTGTVPLYQDKLDAAKDVRKVKNAQGVRNLIEVTGTSVPDEKLTAQLQRKIFYDRIGYFDSPFNFIEAMVKDGTVTLTGDAYYSVSRDSAVAIATRMPGVKDVVDHVRILPTSPFDDRIRRGAMRTIYGDSVLSRYAIDPAKPIRIIVDGGHVTLYGTVQNTMDKQVAGIRAGSLPGAFSVQNNLTVENDSKQGL